jgi:hypothetical protein
MLFNFVFTFYLHGYAVGIDFLFPFNSLLCGFAIINKKNVNLRKLLIIAISEENKSLQI